MQIWNQYCLDSTSARENVYVMTEFKHLRVDQGNMSYLTQKGAEKEAKNEPQNNDSDKGSGNEGNKSNKKWNRNEIPEDKKVGEIFDYSNSEIRIFCSFHTAKELYLQQFPKDTREANDSYQ